MINNSYDLSDEEIWGKEPTWEEQEIERLKKKIEELENKLEDKECIIEMAIDFVKSFEYYIPEDDKSELLKILGDKEGEQE